MQIIIELIMDRKVSENIHYKVWDEVTHPFPKLASILRESHFFKTKLQLGRLAQFIGVGIL